MGPATLLDKNSLQSLSGDEIKGLAQTFYVNAPPVLVSEIIAELKKERGVMKDATHEVAVLAKKMRACLGDMFINAHYRHLCEGELLGHRFIIDGRPVLSGAKRVNLPSGGFGLYYPEHPGQGRLRRLADGNINSDDEVFASKWRAASDSVNIDSLVRLAKQSMKHSKLRDMRGGRDTLKSDMKAVVATRDAKTDEERRPILAALASKSYSPFTHPAWHHIGLPWERQPQDINLTEEGKQYVSKMISDTKRLIEEQHPE